MAPSQSPCTPPRVQSNLIPNSPNVDIRVLLHAQQIAPPISTPISPTKPLHRSQGIADLGILAANTCLNDTPARIMRSQVQHCTITQEAILACMNTYNYINSHSLTPANTARGLFPVKILNAVLDMNTGELLEMRHLLVNPKYKNFGAHLTPLNLAAWLKAFPASAKAPILSYSSHTMKSHSPGSRTSHMVASVSTIASKRMTPITRVLP
jgi:hypothetical protein